MSGTHATDLTLKLLELANNYSFFKREHEAILVAIDGEQRKARVTTETITALRWKLHVFPGSELHGDAAFSGDLDAASSAAHSIDYSAYLSYAEAAAAVESLGLAFDIGARFVEHPREVRMLSESSKFTYRMHCFFGEAYRVCASQQVSYESRNAINKLYNGWRDYNELMIVKHYPAWWPQESRG